MRNVDADAGLTALAVFGASRVGFEFVDLVMPDTPPPETCPSFRDGRPADEELHFNFWDHVEGRAVTGHAPWDDWVPTTSEHVSWYHFDEPPFLPGGTLDPLALVTLCDTMPGAVGERMGPIPKVWLPPSSDLTVHVLADAESEWLLARNQARYAGDGYTSADLELWDPARGLVAYGTQVMLSRSPMGPRHRSSGTPGRDLDHPARSGAAQVDTRPTTSAHGAVPGRLPSARGGSRLLSRAPRRPARGKRRPTVGAGSSARLTGRARRVSGRGCTTWETTSSGSGWSAAG